MSQFFQLQSTKNRTMSPLESWFSLIIFTVIAIFAIIIFINECRQYKQKTIEKQELSFTTHLRKISYINAILVIIYFLCLIWTNSPFICQYYSAKTVSLLHNYYNICISWFQLERLKVCFGDNKNDKNNTRIPYSYPSYLLWFIRIFLFCNAIYSIYVCFFLMNQMSQKPSGCGIDITVRSLEDILQI